jgi:hypothetical protein
LNKKDQKNIPNRKTKNDKQKEQNEVKAKKFCLVPNFSLNNPRNGVGWRCVTYQSVQ